MSFKAPPAPPPMKPMRPQPEATAAPQPKAKPRKPGQMHFALKLFLSLLIAWHVSAVFLAPFSIPPSSTLVRDVAQGTWKLPVPFAGVVELGQPMQWYLDLLYINHGYHFFAPEPGNGHLIRYQVFDSGGRVMKEGEFPNKKDNWPRLLYHRYFMLADQCEVAGETEAESRRWQEDFLKGYAKQILRENPGADSVRLNRVVHYALRPGDAIRIQEDDSLKEFRENPLTYGPTYQVELEVVQHQRDLEIPAPAVTGSAMTQPPQTMQQQNWRQDVASGWQGGVR